MDSWERRVEGLRESLSYKKEEKKLKHNIGKGVKIVPVNTQGKDRLGEHVEMASIIGEFSRLLSNQVLKNKIDLEKISEEVILEDSFKENTQNLKEEFRNIIKQFIKNNLREKSVRNPYFYKFLIDESSRAIVSNYANYINDSLFQNEAEIKSFFSNTKNCNLISKQISKILEKNLSKLDKKNENKLFDQRYYKILIEKFNEDFVFLTEYPDYFLKNIELFFNFYLMIFVYKLTYNVCLKEEGNFEIGQDLYFAYESEKTNEQRRAKNSGFQNYKDKTQKIYYHITTLEHLNIIFEKYNYLYKDLREIYDAIENKEEFSNSINLWLEDYKEATETEKSDYIHKIEDNFEEFYRGYMSVIAESHKAKNLNNTGNRLHKALESISKKNFLKKRGPLGYTFNIDQNFLFFLVAIIAKKERIILKKFFEELELRGISLDNLSKIKIVEILEKNNLIEKKSDSGEAQYVKPVL